MEYEAGLRCVNPEVFGVIVVDPVPLRYRVIYAVRGAVLVTAVMGMVGVALFIAPAAFLTAAIPSFLVSLVILFRK